MTELPIELWHSIFNRLELTDLALCAQVSKKLYFTVKEYRIREIAFTRQLYKWFHYCHANYKDQIDYSKASILKRSSFNFGYLKRLKIGRSSLIELNVINRLVALEELDIDLRYGYNYGNNTLSLVNLQVLYVFVSEHLPLLELDTPRLAKVYTFSLKRLEFFFPDAVRCIHAFDHCGKLPMFRNLEYLMLTDHYNELDYSSSYPSTPSFEEFSLVTLTKLKEIDFYYHHYRYIKANWSILKRVIAKILALGRPDLQVFWFNVRMTDAKLLTKYWVMDETVGSLVAFQLKHYEWLKNKVEFFRFYDFSESMRKLAGAGFNLRSEEFVEKFLARYSFGKMKITGREERELLIKLISGSSKLCNLELEDSDLGQSFMDRISETIQLNGIPLRSLRLKGSNGIRNFEFMLKLLNLQLFKTDQKLSAEIITKLLRLPLLTEINFSSGIIQRTPTGRLRLNGKSLSLEELLKHFDVKPEPKVYRTVLQANSTCRMM